VVTITPMRGGPINFNDIKDLQLLQLKLHSVYHYQQCVTNQSLTRGQMRTIRIKNRANIQKVPTNQALTGQGRPTPLLYVKCDTSGQPRDLYAPPETQNNSFVLC
jgi:hypothetical protein